MLEIDLKAIAENWQEGQKQSGVRCAAVLKANAYGLGADKVGPALLKKGCDTFFVMHAAEGIALRESLSSKRHADRDGSLGGRISASPKIYVLSGPLKETVKELKAFGLAPILNTRKQAELWQKSGKPCGVHLYTGMRRFSMTEKDWYIVRDMQGLKIELLMSHLSSADVADDPMNALQLENFKRLVGAYPKKVMCSLAASEFKRVGPEYYFDMIRTGYRIYGGFGGRPVVTLTENIQEIQKVKKGDVVGYNNAYAFKKPGKIATVFFGYADGLYRSAGQNNLYGYVGEYKVKLIGRVSMDISTFDVSDVPDGVLAKEGKIELLGPRISLDEMGRHFGSIGYEVLTSLRTRSGRIYK